MRSRQRNGAGLRGMFARWALERTSKHESYSSPTSGRRNGVSDTNI
jgi:hypothetical protein